MDPVSRPRSPRKWIRRGVSAGFLFFFIKGLVWLAVLIAAATGLF